ncbi:AarF/ABC1/UbiB kinase family protein [Moritella marina ATCC 15381]|uniref:AarF/ABC1/UbiB kinase family protein n=1 Tax=Moritella marina ATCC 15381 TaxID=1202962 RepID=A0A5J6WJI5_MORMI|nr:AarF/ABC1/UbiB kinase family protein [Moritella marina]QFI36955.1 AarF/ABC1/UbiB kinase family protein [Moritella marina ATCC 15381]
MAKYIGKRVPTSKLSRISKLGSLAVQVAGNVALEGAKQFSQGKRPTLSKLLLTPRNIENLADKLAQLRGAAMKVGQLLSMDAGDLLPKELSILLSKLRSDAHPMPYKQLQRVLTDNWGQDWLDQFSQFELKPFASASIGQVHLAYGEYGEKLAVKVQYPGVRQSIDADVDNVATLLKLSGLLPEQISLDSLLDEAKKQLKVEADYQQEAAFNQRYSLLLEQDPHFITPEVRLDQCTENILIMTYVDGRTIDQAFNQSQQQRDNIATQLIRLFFKELFDFKLMQTDPNFANYLYQCQQDKIVLLDFGATRDIPPAISRGYLALIYAASKSDRPAMQQAAENIGFFGQNIDNDYLQQVLSTFIIATEPLQCQGEYDFASTDLAYRIKQAGMAINNRQDQWHTPPVDAIFIHRKLAGLYLLAAKLNAKVNVSALFKPYIEHVEQAHS